MMDDTGHDSRYRTIFGITCGPENPLIDESEEAMDRAIEAEENRRRENEKCDPAPWPEATWPIDPPKPREPFTGNAELLNRHVDETAEQLLARRAAEDERWGRV